MPDPICVNTSGRVLLCTDSPSTGTRDTGSVSPDAPPPDAAAAASRLRSLTARIGTSSLPIPSRSAEASDLVVGDIHVPGFRVDSESYARIATGTEITEYGRTHTTDRTFVLTRITDPVHPERSGTYLVPSSPNSGVILANASRGAVRVVEP